MVYSKHNDDDFDLADLITQTDASGKPSSVRSPKVRSPRKQGKRFKGAKTVAPPPRTKVIPITEVATDSEDAESIHTTSSFVEGFQSLCCSYSTISPDETPLPRDRPLRRESRRLGQKTDNLDESMASKRNSTGRRESKRQGRKPIISTEAPIPPVTVSPGPVLREKSRRQNEYGESVSSFEEIPEDVFGDDNELEYHEEEEDNGFLLPTKNPKYAKKKTLVLDLDETLVHSSFKAVPWADFAIPVKIGEQSHFVYVTKRPGVDEFLAEMAKYYELVIYTASRDKYADPLLDILDEKRVIQKRLYREHCLFNDGTYVKDLSKLGRDLKETIIVDNAPHSYVFHPDNAIDCTSFIDDSTDRELYQIGGFLKSIRSVKDVRNHCSEWKNFSNPASGSRFSSRGEASSAPLFV